MGLAPRPDPTTRWFVMQLLCLDAPSRGGGGLDVQNPSRTVIIRKGFPWQLLPGGCPVWVPL